MGKPDATKAAERADNVEKIAFLKAFQELHVGSRLGQQPMHIRDEGKTPLRDAAILFISLGELDKKAEAEIVRVFLTEAFAFTRIGETDGLSPAQRWRVQTIKEYLDFIKVCRTRFTGIVPEEFWHEYLLKLEKEARKHTEPDPRGTSMPTSVEEKEALLFLVEELNLLIPLPDIEIHRANIAARIQQVILEDMEIAYTTTSIPPARHISDVRTSAKKHGVSIPTEEQYWRNVATEFINEVTGAVRAMELSIETDQFETKCQTAEALISKNGQKIRRISEKRIPIDESITVLLQRIGKAREANQTLIITKEITEITREIRAPGSADEAADESLEKRYNDLLRLIARIGKIGNSTIMNQLAKELITQQVDPAIKALGAELSADAGKAGELSDKIAKFTYLRKALLRLTLDDDPKR